MKKNERYLDINLSFEERAEDLVSRMSVDEMASQLRYDAPAIERLGIPAYNWWNEGLHGVARAGTATVFPQAIGLAAMFDDEKLYEIACIISTEARAKYNIYSSQGDRDIYKGLTIWSPNINIFRDPRWGRGHETYGEDPYLTAKLGVAFVRGLQQRDKNGGLKTAACAKHYAVHSGPEKLRHEFNAVVSKKDLWETYLPAFEALITEAGVESVMGAYNRTNGEPCCGSKTLIQYILREKWGFSGHVVSDCWAIRDFHASHHVTKSAPESAALALKNGCDLNCGNTYLNLLIALQEGLIVEEDIAKAARRVMATRLRLGIFEENEYDHIPYTVVDCKEHNEFSLESARKSMVLLKNDGILPLDKNKLHSIAVIGPNAVSEEILNANYCGTSSEYITILEGIRQSLPENVRIYYSQGCHLYKDRVDTGALPDDRIAEAKAAAALADIVILSLGLDATLEGEESDTGNPYASGDKESLNLPASQEKLLQEIISIGKPVILLLSTGSAMSINYAADYCNAIIETWYPGAQGGRAAAQLLFGEYSPSGRLPVTFYRSIEDLPSFEDYSMRNRTYRYFKSEALYPFGFGLSYANISYSNLQAGADTIADGQYVTLCVCVKNNSALPCEEVVQAYARVVGSAFSTPNPFLCAFRRISLEASEEKTVQLEIAGKQLMVVNNCGERIIDGTGYQFYVGASQPDAVSTKLMGKSPLSIKIMRQ